METNKKIELLTEIVGELNLSFNEIVAYWRENGKLPPETSEASSGAETIVRYKTPEKILPGMYIYADGLIYPEIIEGRQLKAVVGYVDSSKILGVCLHEAHLSWSRDDLEIEELRKREHGGKEATKLILEASHVKFKRAEAAQWCFDYAEDGVRKGEAFLPSITELRKVDANFEVIDIALRGLGGTSFTKHYWGPGDVKNYWSSSLRDNHNDCLCLDKVEALMLKSAFNGHGSVNKREDHYVRPFLEIRR